MQPNSIIYSSFISYFARVSLFLTSCHRCHLRANCQKIFIHATTDTKPKTMTPPSRRRTALLAALLPLLAPPSRYAAANIRDFTHMEAPRDLLPECKEWAERGDCTPGGENL